MADLEQALDRLLADPEAMAQIMDLAGKLNGPGDAAAQDPGGQVRPLPEDPAPASAAASPDLTRLGPLMALLQSGGGTDPRTEALIQALRPFLSADRRRKLDRAVRLSALVRCAKEAARMWKEGELSV